VAEHKLIVIAAFVLVVIAVVWVILAVAASKSDES
jgi:nitrogen fixation protein FixH